MTNPTMEEVSYYREQALRARRLATEITLPEVREALARLAQEYDEVADDLQFGAAQVRHPELRRSREPL